MGQQLFAPKVSELYVSSPTVVILPPSSVNVGGQQFTNAANLNLNVATTGLGGLDTGVIAINSYYYVYAVLSGVNPGLVGSLAIPTVGPSGFSVYSQIGGFSTDGSGNVAQAWSKTRSAFLITSTGSYTVPYGLKYFKIRAVGGGGNGGTSLAGSGGAAGGYFEAKFKGIPGGTVIPITINGVAASTVVGAPINITATGGGNGVGGGAGYHPGGSGGGVTGSVTPDVITVQGEQGGAGFSTGGVAVEGYGGGSALFNGRGSADAFTGNGPGSAVSYGSGGGGGYNGAAGSGDPGAVLIEEFYS